VNEKNMPTPSWGELAIDVFLCCFTLGVSFQFAAGFSLFGYRRLKLYIPY